MRNLTGWKKDKYDPRDYLSAVRIGKVPDADLSNLIPPVQDQGNIGSCVANAVEEAILSEAKAKKITLPERYSRTYIYNGARYLEGTITEDSGCYATDALRWVKMNGALKEHYWPYDMLNLDTTPPGSSKITKADTLTDYKYIRVVNGVQGILSALAAGHVVCIGNPWFEKWCEPQNGVLPVPTIDDEIAGGHETLIFRSMQEQNLFKGLNSWGAGWGELGCYYMPFKAINIFKQLGGYDAHIITFTKIKQKSIIKTQRECLFAKVFHPYDLKDGSASSIF